MDLITFNQGIEGIQPYDTEQHSPQLPKEPSFVPLGQSIEQHTQTLFNNDSLNSERFSSLANPDTYLSVDADRFTDLIRDTLATLQSTVQSPSPPDNPRELVIFHQAITVMAELSSDRELLLTHLHALNRV